MTMRKILPAIILVLLIFPQSSFAQTMVPSWGTICDDEGTFLGSGGFWPVNYDLLGDAVDRQGGDGCSWMMSGAQMAIIAANTPIEVFSSDITGNLLISFYHSASFLLYFQPITVGGNIKIWYSDGSTTTVDYSFEIANIWQNHQLSIPANPRPIHAVQLFFDPYEQSDNSSIPLYAFFDDFVFTETTTPTATPTRTPIPRTSTPTPTRRATNTWSTPTSIPSPTGTLVPTVSLPGQYSHVPTSIPNPVFPTWPAVPTMAPIATPGPLIASLPTAIPRYTAAAIGALPDPSWQSPPTPFPTVDAWTDDIITYTNWLSAEVAAMQVTDTITMAMAPDWYSPYLPREMANIGWTFEQVSDGSTARYGLSTWAWLFGTMIAMPIKLGRAIMDLFVFMGPFGVFMIWLVVVMLPAVLGFKILIFIKNTIIRLFNFALSIIDWILKLWQALPWWLGGPG